MRGKATTVYTYYYRLFLNSWKTTKPARVKDNNNNKNALDSGALCTFF